MVQTGLDRHWTGECRSRNDKLDDQLAVKSQEIIAQRECPGDPLPWRPAEQFNMDTDEYRADYEGRIGADRMALGLSIIPDQLHGDMKVVAKLRTARTCKTCKWWIEDIDTLAEYTHHHCTNPKIGGGDSSMDGLDDNADWDYGITTGPDFGCIHHQPKAL